jgi:octaprenyl-diphosphate synthase
VGDDFREGKITLPVVLALRQAGDVERAFRRRTLEELDQQEGDLAHAIELYAETARRALSLFREGPEKRALDEAIDFCLARGH